MSSVKLTYTLEMLETLKAMMLQWSKHTFGFVPKAIQKVLVQITWPEGQLGKADELKEQNRKYQLLLDAYNGFWRQRSRSNWLMNGDRNTKYFHHHVNHRHKTNTIHQIRDNTGRVFVNTLYISQVAVEFFSSLFQYEY